MSTSEKSCIWSLLWIGCLPRKTGLNDEAASEKTGGMHKLVIAQGPCSLSRVSVFIILNTV